MAGTGDRLCELRNQGERTKGGARAPCSPAGRDDVKKGNAFWLGGGGQELYIYADPTTEIDLSEVAVGDTYRVNGPVVVWNGLMEVKPRFEGDLAEDPPVDTEGANWSGVKRLFR